MQPNPIIGTELPRKARSGKGIFRRENLDGWLFLSVSLIGYILFRFIPIIFSFVLSFSEWNLVSGLRGIRFTGLENFIEQWSDTWFLHSLVNTFYFSVVSVPISIALSLLAAVIVNESIYFKGFVRLLLYSPHISSMVAISIVWAVLYSPSYGPINMFLQSLGISHPPGWISSSAWAMPSLIIMSIWQSVGYNMVIMLAGLQGIPRDYYEAAEVDGAGVLQRFRSITIPLMSPTLFFVMITSVIGSFQIFAQVNILTKGGPGTSTSVLVYYIYNVAFNYNRLGYANSISWVLFVMIFALTLWQWRQQKKWVHLQ
ncbi:carbohydrate ABC transporter permease [Paenibacillus humicola]|uniref:carbohydrate ABC transporter permease n=1 Tax=Paenibacillus humicola TaxID=3110540 RepID=UPI00237BD378|nr:sugar ABC transporter permease [Paenibacillus humicola]